MRQSAVRVVEGATGAELEVFWTRVGDAPERILRSRVSIAGPWKRWCEIGEPVEVLRPEHAHEGADEPVNQLRDPCLFCDPGDGTCGCFTRWRANRGSRSLACELVKHLVN